MAAELKRFAPEKRTLNWRVKCSASSRMSSRRSRNGGISIVREARR